MGWWDFCSTPIAPVRRLHGQSRTAILELLLHCVAYAGAFKHIRAWAHCHTNREAFVGQLVQVIAPTRVRIFSCVGSELPQATTQAAVSTLPAGWALRSTCTHGMAKRYAHTLTPAGRAPPRCPARWPTCHAASCDSPWGLRVQVGWETLAAYLVGATEWLALWR